MSDQASTSHVPRTPHALPGDQLLHKVEDELVGDIDGAIDRLTFVHSDDTLREHLEVMRTLLRAQVRAYLEHLVARKAILTPHTSVMYAESVGAPGVVATTLHSLLDAGSLTREQAMRLMQLVTDRRTLLIIGERRTGKSTLLNALFELVSLDERMVAIEHGRELPALKDRSFCLRLGSNDAADLPALFLKARRMEATRLVIDDLRSGEMAEFFTLLTDSPRCGGMGSLRAGTAEDALQLVMDGLDGRAQKVRELVGQVRPVFLLMTRDHGELPRLEAIWSAEAESGDLLMLRPIETTPPPGHGLLAEV